MTTYQFDVTIPAGNAAAVNLAAAAFAAGAFPAGWEAVYGTSFLLAAKLICQNKPGATVGNTYLGPATVDSTGANASETLSAATAANPGAEVSIESQKDANVLDLAQYNLHGAVQGTVVSVTFHQV